MKNKEITTEEELGKFLKILNNKRLRKKLPIQKLFMEAHVSLRDWHSWTKDLKENEKRRYPLPRNVSALFTVIETSEKRRFLKVGRPPKLKTRCKR